MNATIHEITTRLISPRGLDSVFGVTCQSQTIVEVETDDGERHCIPGERVRGDVRALSVGDRVQCEYRDFADECGHGAAWFLFPSPSREAVQHAG